MSPVGDFIHGPTSGSASLGSVSPLFIHQLSRSRWPPPGRCEAPSKEQLIADSPPAMASPSRITRRLLSRTSGLRRYKPSTYRDRCDRPSDARQDRLVRSTIFSPYYHLKPSDTIWTASRAERKGGHPRRTFGREGAFGNPFAQKGLYPYSP